MSKLKDLVSRGVRLIVADVPDGGDAAAVDAAAVERETEIPAEAFDSAEPRRVTRSEVSADVADFGAVFAEAGIELPLHGYGIDKVAEMLESKRLATLGREVKATAVMAALEAAQAPMLEVIQDAVQRDRALDAFEAAKERELTDLREQTAGRKKAVQEEIETFLREKNAELEELKKAEDAATAAFTQLQSRKRTEEERLHDVVSHFVEDGAGNPITKGPNSAAPVPPPAPPSRSEPA